MKMDETLYSVQEKIQNFAVIYLVDITKVPDFNKVSPRSPSPPRRPVRSLTRRSNCTQPIDVRK
jgi:hypothetical protein